MTSLRDTLQGALVMAPMTKGSNLPYRQLCQELGARVTMSEMTVARRLKQKRRSEFALIRRAPDERFFGVQLAGNKADEMAWAAALVESRGADLVDVNLGCPIDYFTSKGLGAALAREPRRVRRIVEAMKQAVRVPVTVKIRLGWNDEHRNFLDVARAAIEGAPTRSSSTAARARRGTRCRPTGTRSPNSRPRSRSRSSATAICCSVTRSTPALGTGCTAVMTARGALIKPWLFREATEGDSDPTGDERLAIYRRYVALAKAHWGADEHGVGRIREFLLWHLGFWCRYAPRRADGSYPAMQRRESWIPRTPLEALLARSDAPAHEYLADRLLSEEPIDVDAAPGPAEARAIDDDKAEAG